ncbi:tetraspanin-33-like [Actinia tenebrosa]|uniref:Tetraspanin-33-like n=1 Tax=Actinia tenebrosa TaxID=6105 RepID=A0A6P8IMR6_ACTTE|nr:tetraspanin-33-like [Actinia tenebrosa]
MAKAYKHDVLHGSSLKCLTNDDSVSSCSVYCGRRSTFLLSNGVLCLTGFIVTSFATFLLVVEGSFVQGSSVEYITLTLATSIIIPGIVTLLSCSAVCFASNRRRLPYLYNTLSMIFSCTVMFEIMVFIFGVGQVVQVEELTIGIVEWSRFIQYYQEEHIRNDLDVIQKELKCCGFKSYKDWDLNPYYSCNSTGYSRCSVPFSCCKLKNAGATCVLGIRNPKITEAELRESIYLDGCLRTSQIWYKYSIILLSISALLMACIQGFFLNFMARYVKNIEKESDDTYRSNSPKNEYSSVLKKDTIVKDKQKPSISYVHMEL